VKLRMTVVRCLLLLLLGFISRSLYSQDQTGNNSFVPHVGQPGKDVIWVPTPYELVSKMLEVAGVCDTDYLIDLGSGDGRTVIAAAKLGAHATGVEFNADMIELSCRKAEEAGVSDRAKFVKADLFEYDLSKATVITMFLLPEINLKLRPRLLDLKPGTRIVSNTFTMGEWEPDNEAISNDTFSSWNTALLWIVPAKVEGSWTLGEWTLDIRQEFQKIYGSLGNGSTPALITDGKVKGRSLSFYANGSVFTGKLTSADEMSGTYTRGAQIIKWTAKKNNW